MMMIKQIQISKNWLKKLVHPMSLEKRRGITAEITPTTRPSFNFFLLVVLSCSIATMGLITNSAAVIIGAMLLAPLMSPIIGIGLASISGDTKLLKSSFFTLAVGAMLAVILATLMTLINNALPFYSMQELSAEITSRTHPTPVDMVIALAGGIAAAYALTEPDLSAALPGVAIATALMPPLCTIGIGVAIDRWDVAGGASLLFLTNAVTIAFAAALVFFLRGFSSDLRITDHKVPRSLVIAAGLIVLLLIPLTFYGVKFFREAAENRLINTVVTSEVSKLNGAELVSLDVTRDGDALDMEITIRTASSLDYEQVVQLQKEIVAGLNQSVKLKVNQVIAEQLDPLIAPTATPTPMPDATATFTPTPSPTASLTPLPTLTSTPTLTPTPAQGRVVWPTMPALLLYQEPGGPMIGYLYPGQQISYLYQQQTYAGLEWIQVEDSAGRIGWIPSGYMQLLLPSATPVATEN